MTDLPAVVVDCKGATFSESIGMKTLVEEIADWAAELSYEMLPPHVVTRAKLILLDTLGCALGALEVPPVQMVRRMIIEQGGNPQATPIGASWKTTCDQAAFIDGMALRYLDLNDYTPAGGHPSINVAPALAMAEAQGRSGKDLIAALAVGYELQLRLREAIAGGQQGGWDHSTGVHYSAAAIAAKLFGLPPPRMAHALAIAGSHACTLAEVRKGKLSMWKGAAEPMAAKGGTFAAILAKTGLTGPLSILEGTSGYGTVVAGRLDGDLLRHPPTDFQILQSCVKMWPCVFVAQAPIAAALKACKGRQYVAREIDKIVVHLSEFAYQQQIKFLAAGLTSRESADHSVPYCVARAVLHGEIRLDHFDENNLTDPAATALFNKVLLVPSPAFPEKVGATVEIHLQDGTTLREELPYPPGHTANPARESDVVAKFRTLAAPVLGPGKINRVCDAVLHIEKASDLESLLQGLSRADES